MIHDRRQKIEELVTSLSRERAQTTPESTFIFSVISGTSFLAFMGHSSSAASAVIGVARLIF